MTITSIGVAIDNNDPDAFVNSYLMCIAQGFSMPCPVDKKMDELSKKWAKVMAKHRRDFSDEFCNNVAEKWFDLLARCNTDQPNLELQLCKAANISLKLKKKDEEKKKTAISDIPEALDSKDGLTPAISNRYRERQQAEAVSLPELARLEAIHKSALQAKDPTEFLITHLTFSKYGKFQEIPKSSVPQNIRSGWEEIIASMYNTIAPDSFLETLTNDWFYLVNQKGIPTKLEQQQDLLITYLAKVKRDSNPENKSKKNDSILKRLFGK